MRPLSLETPKRVPITDQAWLRYMEELTATTNTQTGATGVIEADILTLFADMAAVEVGILAADAVIREMRFLAGW